MARTLFLSEAERARLEAFPETISQDDIAAYFALSRRDLMLVRRQRGDTNRLGFAIALGSLRYLGFVPGEVADAPADVVEFVASQLAVPPTLAGYPARAQTRTTHVNRVAAHLGFRKASAADLGSLQEALVGEAGMHARPTALLAWVCERAHRERVFRPGLTTLERMVVRARRAAEEASFQSLAGIIEPNRDLLMVLLDSDPELGQTRLGWLRQRERTNSPRAIARMLAKHEWLEQAGVADWNMGDIHPNRVRYLARLGSTADPQTLRRLAPRRRFPALIAFLRQALIHITDELIDMFDRCLTEMQAKARLQLREHQRKAARARDEVVAAFLAMTDVVLNSNAVDLRRALYRRVPHARMEELRAACLGAARPLDEDGLDFLRGRYNHIRQFSKRLLEQLEVKTADGDIPVQQAINTLRAAADAGIQIPEDSPTEFVPRRWRRFVITDDGIDRRYYELCVLWRLRGAFRQGNAWVDNSRRFAPIDTYSIAPGQWRRARRSMIAALGAPSSPARALKSKAQSLVRLEQEASAATESGPIRVEDGSLVIPPLVAEQRSPTLVQPEATVDAQLPRVELFELLLEVERWTGFGQHLLHAGDRKPPKGQTLRHVVAAILAHGCNVGFTRMAEMAGMSFREIAWSSTWHLGDETLKKAFSAVVDHHHRQPLAAAWGAGTLSSSDGQRFPVRGRVSSATALPRYFGYGRGVTFYTWTSDQYSQYGTKVICATNRDAPHVLDEILDNETELELLEHTTDTAGYTDLLFALFDLLGMRFAPRIRDSAATRLYRLEGTKSTWTNVAQAHVVKRDVITKHWDDMLRIAASLRSGHVTASLLVSRLQAHTDSGVGRALVEYGRLCKTEHVLRYYAEEGYRRRIGTQLNKGEALHAVRRFLVFGNIARLGPRDTEALANQAACLNLITNAVILWNTVYIQRVLDGRERRRRPAAAGDIARLSPAPHEHINPYGTYRFDRLPAPGNFRPLRA